MIYIVGLQHALQIGAYDGSAPGHSDLVDAAVMERVKAGLAHWVDTLEINVIAEEMTRQAIERRGMDPDETPAVAVCRCKGIPHEFVDVDSQERFEIAAQLSDRVSITAIREAIWSDRLARYYGHNVLMLCGAVHVATFALTLLNYNDVDQLGVTILHREWVPIGCKQRFVASGP